MFLVRKVIRSGDDGSPVIRMKKSKNKKKKSDGAVDLTGTCVSLRKQMFSCFFSFLVLNVLCIFIAAGETMKGGRLHGTHITRLCMVQLVSFTRRIRFAREHVRARKRLSNVILSTDGSISRDTGCPRGSVK